MHSGTQIGGVIWFTGLSNSGKTSISRRLSRKLSDAGYRVELLDGDIVRQSLTKDLGFSPEDRDINIERVTFVARLLARNNVFVLCAFISPYKKHRQYARGQVDRFLEVYVDAPLEVCERRDTKGLYKKAREGEIQNFTGISDPYEVPEDPDITVKTDEYNIDQSVDYIYRQLKNFGWIEGKEDMLSSEEEELMKRRLEDLGYL